MKPPWWEKTVEYAFVLEMFADQGFDFALPLSGVAERMAGDAIFGAASRLVLIEFKRGIKSFDSEKKKYSNYEAAQLALEEEARHHLFVYGVRKNDRLATKSVEYFFRSDVPIEQVFMRGIEASFFKAYVAKLVRYRNRDGRSKGGRSRSNHLSTVFGVSQDGKATGSMSLDRYITKLLPSLRPQPTHAHVARPSS